MKFYQKKGELSHIFEIGVGVRNLHPKYINSDGFLFSSWVNDIKEYKL